jgi:hypothetical protein
MSSRRAVRRRGCARKVRHATAALAQQQAARAPGLQVYKCQFCAGYHVGTPEQHRGQRRGKRATHGAG